ncbi:MAG: YbfB/YjiJ family MFS transporter [Acidimicrobiia bacterium]|nr:YbfB/YjiJ family MFS transporter [Acidimicrobiia bacterium]
MTMPHRLPPGPDRPRVSAGLLAFSLTLVPLTALGLGRFAYGLLLPDMRAQLGWSYLQAGAVTTANAAAYLLGALLAGRVMAWVGMRASIVGTNAAVAVSLLATAASPLFAAIVAARFCAGVFGGVSFVAASTLAAALSAGGVPNALVWFPTGAGAAIVLTAAGQALLRPLDVGWPAGWLLLGALACLATVGLARAVPAEDRRHDAAAPRRAARLPRLEASYALFGFGYLGYLTFVAASLRRLDASARATTTFWLVLGLSGLLAATAWPRLIGRRSSAGAYPIAVGLSAAGAAVVLVAGPVAPLLSAVLFGGSFMAVVTTMTGAARDAVPRTSWPVVLGRLTVAFGIGQAAGPLAIGRLADTAGGLRAGLAASAGLLFLAAVVGRRPSKPRDRTGRPAAGAGR